MAGLILIAGRLCAATVLCLGALAGAAPPTVAEEVTVAKDHEADFNGDGWADVAVLSDDRSDDNLSIRGVHIIYGGRGGLAAQGNQYWTADDFLPWDRDNSLWADAVTVGNFNGDRFSDLAVGGPTEGRVRVIFGSNTGLTTVASQVWTPDLIGLTPVASSDFGYSLVAANFGRGPHDDLAIGMPSANRDAGAVAVLYGSASGLSAVGSQVWSQDSAGVLGGAEDFLDNDDGHGDRFGSSLAAGRFSGGEHSDLAVGVPQEGVGSVGSAGGVSILRGSEAGLTATGNQVWSQGSPDMAGAAEADDGFGTVLVAGDFQADGRDDLAVSTPWEDTGRLRDAGAVNVIYGSPDGLSTAGNQLWSQNSRGIAGSSEAFDLFGMALTVGQFGVDRSGRRYADLAIGTPAESIGKIRGAGGVHVLFGSPDRLTSRHSQFWSQNTAGIRGRSEEGDAFGFSLTSADFGQDTKPPGYSDLAIGAVGETTEQGQTGVLNILSATSTGLTPRGDQTWSPNRLGLTDIRFAIFGWRLVAR